MSQFVILMWVLLFGCTKEEAECSETRACGFGEVCRLGECITQSCATSAQCEIEHYCNNGDCTEGCESDKDCYPGDVCDADSRSCVSGYCTDTHIDCDFKEFCNGATGECSEASGIYCKECEVNADCGGNGNVCMHWGLQRDFCGVTCERDEDCPAGFTCTDWNDTENGQIVRQCATYCWLYTDDRPIPEDNANANQQIGTECLETPVVKE
jgi:hypothetical protein